MARRPTHPQLMQPLPSLQPPSASPNPAADAALLNALLGAGGGHGLGGPFGGRPVSSTEQTIRDQLLITVSVGPGHARARGDPFLASFTLLCLAAALELRSFAIRN